MKAYTKRSANTTEITLSGVPIPKINQHELLIKLHAVGVGIHDEYFHPIDIDFPYVIGIEGAGVIIEIGSRVTDYKVGERVMFVNAMNPKGGTWAEYTSVVDTSLIIRIPEAMAFSDAASLPVVGSNILKVFRTLNLQQGSTVFIAGGSGAIGTLAIQIAVARNYTVIASASKNNHEYMESLGATKTVDYHDPNWHDQIKEWFPDGVDGVIAIQPDTARESETIVKERGTIVTVSGEQFNPGRRIVLKQVQQNADIKDELTELINQITSGDIKLNLESFPFIDAPAALQKVQTRHARGKLVLNAITD